MFGYGGSLILLPPALIVLLEKSLSRVPRVVRKRLASFIPVRMMLGIKLIAIK